MTGDFIYARLREAVSTEPTGYTKEALETWANRAERWASGESTLDLPLIANPIATSKRDVFVYFINGAKERAPAAAMALFSHLHPGN